MRVFLTGATGFVGSYVLRDLVDAGHTARCLVRDPNTALAVDGAPVERVQGDVTDAASLEGAMDGCDAVIHLVGIIDEAPRQGVTFEAVHVKGTIHVARAAREAGIDRFLHMSANGARLDGVSAYQTTKWRAETYVRDAGFDHWTVFRPSVVFGDPGPEHPEFASRLAKTLVRPFPIWPVFGDGQYQLAPISVEEVAAAFVQALTRDAAARKTYTVCGWEAYPYTEVLDRIARGMGIDPKPKLFVPTALARPLVQILSRLNCSPISIDQFEMLLAGNLGDPSAFYDDFDVAPKRFTPEHLTYVRNA